MGEDGSGCGFRIPTTPCNVATISYINTPFSGYFRPAPVSVSNLGEALFNGENWNTQLPGNSGSGVDMNIYAGHPKVKVPLTSEIYWDFSELELKGTPPTLSGGGSSDFVPFSGSEALSGNKGQLDQISDKSSTLKKMIILNLNETLSINQMIFK